MKLVRCEWAPSLVVEWLCGELEERGIPGPTYAHTLLSLLHHHYCPHPAPTTPISASTCSPIGTGNYQHPLSRRHLDDFDLRDLDLDDLLGHTAHPDADLPDFATFSTQQVILQLMLASSFFSFFFNRRHVYLQFVSAADFSALIFVS